MCQFENLLQYISLTKLILYPLLHFWDLVTSPLGIYNDPNGCNLRSLYLSA